MLLNKKLKTLIVGIGAIIGGIFYRMGGSGNFPRQARVVGVPVLCGIVLGILHWNWWILLCVPIMIAPISTYFKKKGTDATFINFWLHGFGIALSFLPYAISTGCYFGFGIRLVALPLVLAWWSMKIGNDIVEELGRGFFITITIPLLLI